MNEDQKCDTWIDAADHRCQNRRQHTVTLNESTRVGRGPMMGTYPPGTWHFCNTHFRIFNRDREVAA